MESKGMEWQENEMAVVFSDDSSMPEGYVHYPPLSEQEQHDIDIAMDNVMAKYGI